jgi:hypothetical protein
MEKLKICIIGATNVGKTSLVTRFVSSIFSERYQTTIGVKIQARRMQRGDRVVDLILWDLSGEDEFQHVQLSYLRGAAGYLLVADGTRRETIDTAVTLQARTQEAIGDRPFVFVLNKTDLVVSWEVGAKDLQALEGRGWAVVRTSAKSGAGVEEAFNQLVDGVLARRGRPWT